MSYGVVSGSTGHAMRNCFFQGMYSSTIWTAGIAGDLDYRNNVVDSANYVWIVAERSRPEPVATATVTEGFYLPARFVIHTVGPIVQGGAPSSADCDALGGCYHACLAATVERSIGSIAFCAISTGVFGYPKPAAARVSLAAIRDFLAALDRPPHVILVAFTEDDEAVYRNVLEEAPE